MWRFQRLEVGAISKRAVDIENELHKLSKVESGGGYQKEGGDAAKLGERQK